MVGAMFVPMLLCAALTGCLPQSPDTTLIVSEDPELGEMARQVLADVSERAGMSLHRPVRVASRSRAFLEGYLATKLDEELPVSEARHITAVYALLGQASPDLDLRSLLASVYGEQVVGFYEPDSTALFVVDDQPPETIEPILVHELVHAIQDQNRSLDSLTADERGNDAQVAAQAAIEGHATLVMMEWMFSRMGGQEVDFESLPDFRGMIGPLLESVRDQYPMLAEAPRVVQEGLLYPYLEGAGYVMAVWRSAEGRPSPIAERLPESTEQVSAPEKKLSDPVDAPVRIRFDHDAVVYQNNLGSAELGVVLSEWAGAEAGRGVADGWAGDQFALFGEPGAWSLRWIILWDDTAARDRFVEALPTMPNRPGGLLPVTGEAGGRPSVVLDFGSPPDVVPHDGGAAGRGRGRPFD